VENTQTLPMKWWNFFKYFRFPVSILIWGISLLTVCNNVSDIEFSWFSIILVLIPAIYMIFQIIVYINFIKKTKIGYKLLIFSLFVELVINSILYASSNSANFNFTQSIIIYSGIWTLIFVYPNYVYFSKRKHIFERNEELHLVEHKNISSHHKSIPKHHEIVPLDTIKETFYSKNNDTKSLKKSLIFIISLIILLVLSVCFNVYTIISFKLDLKKKTDKYDVIEIINSHNKKTQKNQRYDIDEILNQNEKQDSSEHMTWEEYKEKHNIQPNNLSQ